MPLIECSTKITLLVVVGATFLSTVFFKNASADNGTDLQVAPAIPGRSVQKYMNGVS